MDADLAARVARARAAVQASPPVQPTEEDEQRLMASMRRLGADEDTIRTVFRPSGRARRRRWWWGLLKRS